MTVMHTFGGNTPAAAQQIAAAPGKTLPLPVASAGQEGSVRTIPVCSYSSSASLGHTLPGGRSGARVNEEDRIFSVAKNCSSCGTCQTVCPVGNIELVGKEPVWKHHCELCLACIRTCPAQAIQVGERKSD